MNRVSRPSVRLLLRTLPLVIGLCSVGARAEGEADAWQQPFELRLPDPVRTLTLDSNTDARDWILKNRLDQARVVPFGRRGAIVEVAMDDAAWESAQADLCAQPEVSSCEATACQAIQFDGVVSPGEGRTSEQVQARLVKNPPERVPLPDEVSGDDEAGGSGSCKGPPLIPPLDSAGTGVGGNVSVDLSLIDAIDGGVSGNSARRSGTAARRAFEFPLLSGSGAQGVANFATDQLPEDTSDWTLVAGAGCSEVSVPLDSLSPARVPGVVLAVVDQAATAAVAAANSLTVIREIRLDSTSENLVVFLSRDPVPTVLAALALDARVRGAQPEHLFTTTATAADSPAGSFVEPYSDPYATLTYGPQQTRARELQGFAGGSGAVVAVIDTGVAQDHEEFQGRLEAGVDTTGSGFSADIHGTAVAGIIAAAADNGIGSYGVAPKASILPIKACEPREAGSVGARCRTSALVKALDTAMQRDAAIINLSLAGPPDDLLARFIALAVGQDRLLVAGAGNGGTHAKPAFPAALPGVLAVTAVDAAGRIFIDANTGGYIDVAAPGVDIVSTAPGGQYPALSGTSMAAAHISGVLALLKELAPSMGSAELVAMVKSQARDLGDPGVDARFGAGLVDACATAALATADAIVCSPRAASESGAVPVAALKSRAVREGENHAQSAD